jgi:hypothetical protein
MSTSNPVSSLMAWLLFALGGLGASAALAQNSPAPQSERAALGTALSPKARGALVREFVLKWGDHVERVYDIRVGVWAQRMGPSFAAADPDNLRNALVRATFEGAMAELTGQGHRLSDRRAVTRLMEASRAAPGDMRTKLLGDGTGDLVYTPLQPCRIVDTRNMSAGAIAANSTRDFAIFLPTYVGQGGSATDCGTTGLTFVGALAMNVTAVTPNAAGFATVYPFNSTRPLAASVNYTAGAIVNNGVITKIPFPLQPLEFTIYTFAQSHYVVDVVGYFSAPQATPVQCITTGVNMDSIAAGATATFFGQGCPAGYGPAGATCIATASGVHSKGSGLSASSIPPSGACVWQNTTASAQTVSGSTICCRVPGR